MLLNPVPSYSVATAWMRLIICEQEVEEHSLGNIANEHHRMVSHERLRAGGSKAELIPLSEQIGEIDHEVKRQKKNSKKSKFDVKKSALTRMKLKFSSNKHKLRKQTGKLNLRGGQGDFVMEEGHIGNPVLSAQLSSSPNVSINERPNEKESHSVRRLNPLVKPKSLLIPDMNLTPFQSFQSPQGEFGFRRNESFSLQETGKVQSELVVINPTFQMNSRTEVSQYKTALSSNTLKMKDEGLKNDLERMNSEKTKSMNMSGSQTLSCSAREVNKVKSNKLRLNYNTVMYDLKKHKSKLSASNLAKASKLSLNLSNTGDMSNATQKKCSFVLREKLSDVSPEMDKQGSHITRQKNSLKCLYKNVTQDEQKLNHEETFTKYQKTSEAGYESDSSTSHLLAKPDRTVQAMSKIQRLAQSKGEEQLNMKSSQRIFVLMMYCAVASMQVIINNTWGSIADSVLFAYKSYCKPKSVALLSNWGSLSLLVCILPVCYILHKKGLRKSMLLACGCCTLGAGIRCLPLDAEHFISLAHVGAILNAMGGVVFGPAIVMLSSTWFPVDERTFATGVGTSLSLLGAGAAYFLGPILVTDPTKFSFNLEDARLVVRNEIKFYMFLCFVAELVLFVLMIFFFPDKPAQPISKASTVSLSLNLNCLESFKLLLKNGHITLLSMSAALLNGPSSPWLSLLTMILTQRNISQNVAAKLGFWTIISGCFLGLLVSKLSDMYPGYIKQTLMTFIWLASLMFVCIALITSNVIVCETDKLLVAILVGISCSWATSALFYELGAEIAYPVPESIVAGYMSCVSSIAVATVYAYIYLFPSVDVSWLNYALVVFSFASIVSLLCVNVEYNRSNVDRSHPRLGLKTN